MKYTKFILILLLVFLFINSNSQTAELDNLRHIIETSTEDTTKINSLNKLGQLLIRQNINSALDTINLSIKHSISADYDAGLANAYKVKGIIYFYKQKLDTSLHYLRKSLQIYQDNNEKLEAAKIYNNIGIVQKSMGYIDSSIISYSKSRKYLEEIGDTTTLIAAYINLSNVFRNIGNYEKAIELNYKALSLLDSKKSKKIKDSLQIGHIYKSIANINTDQENWELAEKNYQKSLRIFKKSNSAEDIGDIYLNLGVVETKQDSFSTAKEYYLLAKSYYKHNQKLTTAYLNLGEVSINLREYSEAKKYLDSSLQLCLQSGDSRSIALSYATFGKLLYANKEYSASLEKLKIAIDTARNIGDISILKGISETMYKAYKAAGNYREALRMHELYKEMNDSIFNSKNERSLTQMSLQYEYNKLQQEEELKYQSEMRRKKLVQNASYIVLATLLIITLLVVLSRKAIKKRNNILKEKNAEIIQQNEEIEAQKEEIETQNKEIEKQRDIAVSHSKEIDASIRYAYKIQQAVIPNVDILKNIFTEHFIFFKPRDIVSGDFYWVEQKGNNIVIVAADCTGHGVPGAFMSMLGVSFLNQIIGSSTELVSSKILDKLREMVISSMKQNISDVNSSKDGMDISLVIFNTENQQIQFSGAYNSLYIVSEHELHNIDVSNTIRSFEIEASKKVLREIKADRMPIGVFIKEVSNFTNNIIQLQPKDRFYMFSDGYSDMFDKKTGNKFTSRRFKRLLLETSDVSIREQQSEIESEYHVWCGGDKQIDDIVVIGVEI